MSNQVIKHRFSNQPPLPHEVAIGELVLQLFKDTATLYTKDINGQIIELGKGALRLEDLKDVDLTNVKDGAFLTKQGDKFIASNLLGNLNSLNDVEVASPQAGEYLRYDPVFLSFKNFKPSYNLYQLLDVDVLDPTDPNNSYLMSDKVLYYDHPSGKFKLRDRRNVINELDDVEILASNSNQILQLDTDGVWKNMALKIERDTEPRLGGDLDGNGYQICNSTYRVNTVVCDQPIRNIDYKDGDYWILEGVPLATNEQCIVNISFNTAAENAVAILMLEIRQNTGNILIGGLQNVHYEDGKPLMLSGNGRTDLVTITIQKIGTDYKSYITANALNLATLGNGGTPAYRYIP